MERTIMAANRIIDMAQALPILWFVIPVVYMLSEMTFMGLSGAPL